ncbi:MAG TPA: hypothetical protein VHJ78_00375 [Actinomycetota bacterium]|nr:hypothetical protein [Actinomycetota bacterium]
MPRRASLPGADLLFGAPAEKRQPRQEPLDREPVAGGDADGGSSSGSGPSGVAAPEAQPSSGPVLAPTEPAAVEDTPAPAAAADVPVPVPARPAARPRHDEKVTFYCTDADLTRLEAARLTLRARHKLSSDRGRIVRAALAEVLDDFDARGADSLLVKRLSAE